MLDGELFFSWKLWDGHGVTRLVPGYEADLGLADSSYLCPCGLERAAGSGACLRHAKAGAYKLVYSGEASGFWPRGATVCFSSHSPRSSILDRGALVLNPEM